MAWAVPSASTFATLCTVWTQGMPPANLAAITAYKITFRWVWTTSGRSSRKIFMSFGTTDTSSPGFLPKYRIRTPAASMRSEISVRSSNRLTTTTSWPKSRRA